MNALFFTRNLPLSVMRYCRMFTLYTCMRNPKRPIEIKPRTNVKFYLKNHPFLNTFKEIIANFAPPMKQNYLLTLIMCLLLRAHPINQGENSLIL